MTDATILDHVFIGVIATFVFYAVFFGQPGMKGKTLDTRAKLATYWSNGALLWIGAIAACAAWMLGGRALADLGLTWRHANLAAGAAITAALLLWAVVELRRGLATEARRAEIVSNWRRDVPFMPETPPELAHFSFMGITAGVTEELVMRGYAISYVRMFTGDSTLGLAAAVVLPAIVFGFAHRYEGFKAMSRIFFMATAAGAIFVFTGSLLIPIVLHALLDIAAGVISLRLTAEHPREAVDDIEQLEEAASPASHSDRMGPLHETPGLPGDRAS